MNAAHRQTGADLHAPSTSGPITSQAQRESQHSPAFQVLSDRQAVIAVMAANGRTNRQISLRLKIPVQAVEQYLNEARDILQRTSQHELTHPVITAHFNKTSPTPTTRTTHQHDPLETNTPAPQATTPGPAPQTLEPNPTRIPAPAPAPAPESAAGTVSASKGGSMPLFGVSDQFIDDHFVDTLGPSSLVLTDAAEAAQEADGTVQGPEQEPGHDHNDNDDPDQGAAPERELITALELLQQERARVENLQRALHTRDVIGQAKGILMARYKISADAAFAILQDESSRTNQKIVDLAAQLTYTG